MWSKADAKAPYLKDVYDKHHATLKWILVNCLAYLGYKNAKFGAIN